MKKETIIAIFGLLVPVFAWLISKEDFFDYIRWYYSWRGFVFAFLWVIFAVSNWLLQAYLSQESKTWNTIVLWTYFGLIAFMPLIFPLSLSPEIEIRIKGSNTIGAEYMPLLVTDYAQRHGATSITTNVAIGSHHTTVFANFENGFTVPTTDKKIHSISFEIDAEGTDTGFADLDGRIRDGNGSITHAHIWMASSPLGESSDYNNLSYSVDQILIGFDGITVIAHSGLIIKSLKLDQIRDIFNGKIKTWLELGSDNKKDQIEVCIRRQSGTTHEFERDIGLDEGTLDKIAPSQLKFVLCDTNACMIACVSEQPFRLGYAPFAMAMREQNVKILGIQSGTAPPVFPTVSNILKRTYDLSRDLYSLVIPI